MSRVALPVKSDKLDIFINAGHTPYFAIFDIVGEGAFKSSKLIELRENPRVNLDAEFGCSAEHGEHGHDEDDEEHKKGHEILGEILKDCDILIAKKACKNSIESLKKYSIEVKKIDGDTLDARVAIAKAL